LKVAKVDATQHSTISSRFGVSGYPTIKFFPGKKADPIDYEGGRNAAALKEWAMNKKLEYGEPSFTQLVDSETFKENCENVRGLCLISFIPHIYDSSKEERNGYLDMITEIANKYKGRPIKFLWS